MPRELLLQEIKNSGPPVSLHLCHLTHSHLVPRGWQSRTWSHCCAGSDLSDSMSPCLQECPQPRCSTQGHGLVCVGLVGGWQHTQSHQCLRSNHRCCIRPAWPRDLGTSVTHRPTDLSKINLPGHVGCRHGSPAEQIPGTARDPSPLEMPPPLTLPAASPEIQRVSKDGHHVDKRLLTLARLKHAQKKSSNGMMCWAGSWRGAPLDPRDCPP